MGVFHGDREEIITAVAKISSEFMDMGGEMSTHTNWYTAPRWCIVLAKFMAKSEDIAEGMLYLSTLLV